METKHSSSSGLCVELHLSPGVQRGMTRPVEEPPPPQRGPTPNAVMKQFKLRIHMCGGKSSTDNLPPWLGHHPNAVMKLSYMCEHGHLGLGNFLMVIDKQVAVVSLQLPGIIACPWLCPEGLPKVTGQQAGGSGQPPASWRCCLSVILSLAASQETCS